MCPMIIKNVSSENETEQKHSKSYTKHTKHTKHEKYNNTHNTKQTYTTYNTYEKTKHKNNKKHMKHTTHTKNTSTRTQNMKTNCAKHTEIQTHTVDGKQIHAPRFDGVTTSSKSPPDKQTKQYLDLFWCEQTGVHAAAMAKPTSFTDATVDAFVAQRDQNTAVGLN